MTKPQTPVGERDSLEVVTPFDLLCGHCQQHIMHAGTGTIFNSNAEIWCAQCSTMQLGFNSSKRPSPPPETHAAEEWISRDDHIAAIEAIRAEYMQRLLGAEPRAAAGWFLPRSALNELQIATLEKFLPHAKRANEIDCIIRKDAQETHYELDFIKHLTACGR